MRQEYISDVDVKNCLLDIIRQMYLNGFKPDAVAGLVRGGAVPANFISQFFDIPCYMVNKDEVPKLPVVQNLLVIDDINDTGTSFTEFNNLLFDLDFKEVKFASLINNAASSFEVDFSSIEINKLEDPCWIIFPWENWWMTIPDHEL